jgi:DNA mismatch endonuclease Vsr
MVRKRPKEVVSYNMSRIRSQGTKLEEALERILETIPVKFVKHPKMFGKPDFAYPELKIAVFADSDFWHGYDWWEKKKEIKTNKEFWIKKIERNMERDEEVTRKFQEQGWVVIRLWGHEINQQSDKCRTIVEEAVNRVREESVVMKE